MSAETADIAAARRLDGLIWIVIVAVAVIDLSATIWGSFYIEWHSFAAPLIAAAVLTGAGVFYRRWRKDPRLAAGLQATAQVIAFAAVGAPLSYIAASAGLPLQDGTFSAIDHALGFDWRGWLAWMNAHPRLHLLFALAYLSFTVQAATTVLALSFSNQLFAIRRFVLAFMFSALVSIAISTLLPAEGTWGFYHVQAADYAAIVPSTRDLPLPIFNGLRDGSLRALTGMSSEGIISFPSFHAALGVTFLVALWPVRILRWIGAAVNVTMIVATPIEGSHYLVDVIAGILVAVLCLFAARFIVRSTPRPQHATSVKSFPEPVTAG